MNPRKGFPTKKRATLLPAKLRQQQVQLVSMLGLAMVKEIFDTGVRASWVPGMYDLLGSFREHR